MIMFWIDSPVRGGKVMQSNVGSGKLLTGGLSPVIMTVNTKTVKQED